MTGVVLSVERLVDVEVSRTTLIPATPSPSAAAAAVASSSAAAAEAVACAAKRETRIVKSVPSSLLGPVLRFCPDQHVIHRERGWLGRVAHVDEVLTLRFADGVVAEVRPREPGGKPLDDAGVLLPTTKSDAALSDGHRCPFYPGQVVDARSVAALRTEARLKIVSLPGSGSSGGPRGGGGGGGQRQGAGAQQQVRALRATVLKVEADELEVDWIAPLPAMARAREGGEEGGGGGGGGRGARGSGGSGGARGLLARFVSGVSRGGNNDGDDRAFDDEDDEDEDEDEDEDDEDEDDDAFDAASGLPRSMRLPPDVVRPVKCEPVGNHFFDPSYWHLGTRGLWLGGWEDEEEKGKALPSKKKKKRKKQKKKKKSRKEEEEEEEEAEEEIEEALPVPAPAAPAAAPSSGLGFVAAAVRSAVASLLPSSSAASGGAEEETATATATTTAAAAEVSAPAAAAAEAPSSPAAAAATTTMMAATTKHNHLNMTPRRAAAGRESDARKRRRRPQQQRHNSWRCASVDASSS